MADGGTRERWDFFLSYTQADRAWAEWIAWLLEEDGYRVLIQAWDFVPGSNWIQGMETGVREAARTIAVLSDAYLGSVYGAAEWQAAWAADPGGDWRKLLVARVSDTSRPGLLAGVIGVDLFGADAATASAQLRAMASTAVSGRAKPPVRPHFPGTAKAIPQEPQFPGIGQRLLATAIGRRPHKAIDEATSFAANRKAVMVIYGHDIEAKNALFDWLRAIRLEPRQWNQMVSASGSASPYIGDVLSNALNEVQAVIALFTPDEYVTAAASQGDLKWRLQARPNVLIEAGMALVTHPTRTIIVTLGNQELPSDLAGRLCIRLSNTAVEPLHDLAERLQVAGCEPDTSGTDWLVPARFPDRSAKPLPESHPLAGGKPAQETRGHAIKEPQPQHREEDKEARQVTVVIEEKPGVNYTHLVTVSTPVTYPVKQVEGQIIWQTNNGLGMIGFGFSGNPPQVDGHYRRYLFRASINPIIHNPEPVIRFVDLSGNRYYQFRHHTQRFPRNTDWLEAANAIDEWLRTGPSSD